MPAQIYLTLVALAYLAITFFWLFAAKLLFDRLSPATCDDSAITQDSNLAVAIRRAGLYLAIPLGMLGAVSGPGSGGLAADLLALFVDGAILVVLLLVASWVSEFALVPGIDNRRACAEGNLAVALVEFGAFVATGFIARGALTGEGGGWISAAVFFVLGQVALVLIVLLYERLTPFHLIEEIRGGNTAAGLMTASMTVSLGIVLSTSIAGDFTGWSTDLVAFAEAALGGIAALLLLAWPVEKLFLPRTTLSVEISRDRNVAAVVLVAALHLALAMLVSTLFV